MGLLNRIGFGTDETDTSDTTDDDSDTTDDESDTTEETDATDQYDVPEALRRTGTVVEYETYTFEYTEHDAVLHHDDGTTSEWTFDEMTRTDRGGIVLKDYTSFELDTDIVHVGGQPFKTWHRLRPAVIEAFLTIFPDRNRAFETIERRTVTIERTDRSEIHGVSPGHYVREGYDERDDVVISAVRRVEDHEEDD